MTDASNTSTKIRITEVASELFAKFGYNGTSVRDIAQQCDVNIAAINYHFGSKSNLYWEIVCQAHAKGAEGINKIAEQSKNIEDMVIKMYDFFLTQQTTIRTIMRIMMTEGVPEPEGEILENMKSRKGPPGIQAIEKILSKEVSNKVPKKAITFASRSIYFQLMQIVIAKTSSKRTFMERDLPEFSNKAIKEHLKLNIQAMRDFITQNPKTFK